VPYLSDLDANIPRSAPATFEALSDRTKSFNGCSFRSVVDCQELFCKLDKHCLEAARELTNTAAG
jgi:hypothetical protein